MTAVVVAPLAAGNPGRYAELAAALSVLVGVLAVVGWLLRLGFVGDLLSAPILVGYLVGIGVIMIVGQLGKVTGVHVTGDSLLGELKSFLTQLDTIRWNTVLLSVLTLTFLFVVAWRWPRLPGPLLAVLAVTGVTALFHLQEHGSRPPPLARSSSTPRPGSSTWLSSAGSPGTGAASWCFP